MKSILIVFLTIIGAAVADLPVVNTPSSVAQCLPSSITFGQGTGPYFLTAIPGGQPGAAALKEFPQGITSPYTWVVDLPAGTSITLQIRDSAGQLNYSQQVTIQPGKTDCMSGANSGTTTSPSPSPAPSAPAATTPAPANTTGMAANPNVSTATTTPVKTNTTSPTNTTKGASPFITPTSGNNTVPSTTNPSVSSVTANAAAGASSAGTALNFNLQLLATMSVITTIIAIAV